MWDFDLLPSTDNKAIRADNIDADILDGLPLLDLTTSLCPCTGTIDRPTDIVDMMDDSHDTSSDEETDMTDTAETDFSSITLRCRGCTYEPHQSRIAQLRELHSYSIILEAEPQNQFDRNAIAFKGQMANGEFQIIGYVGVHHIPRVHKAIKEGDVFVKVDLINRKYNSVAKKPIYKCFCVLTKAGRWGPVSAHNIYNSTL